MSTGSVDMLLSGRADPLAHHKQMAREAQALWQKSIRETGADPLWWKLVRNPAFRQLTDAIAHQSLLKSVDELVRRRADELRVLRDVEEQLLLEQLVDQAYRRRLRAIGLRLAAEPLEGLDDLLRKLRAEQRSGSTFGIEAEFNVVSRELQQARAHGDRLVLLGKWTGAKLKTLFRRIDPSVDLSRLSDDATFAGDLIIIGLDPREFRAWVGHYSALSALYPSYGHRSRTVQMKWGESPDPADTEYNITLAGIQLQGQRSEVSLPFAQKEISIGLLNPAHPWNLLDNRSAERVIVPAIRRAFAAGDHSGLGVSASGLYPYVTRVVVHATNWTFTFANYNRTISLESCVYTPRQHDPLLASPRPGRPSPGARSGTLIALDDGAYRIQAERGSTGQKSYDISKEVALRLGLPALLPPLPPRAAAATASGAPNAPRPRAATVRVSFLVRPDWSIDSVRKL